MSEPVKGLAATLSADPDGQFGVLDGRRLFGLDPVNPRFWDMTWDLTASIESADIQERAVLKINFLKISPTYRDQVRKYCAARLLGPEPLSLTKRFRRPSGLTVAKEFTLLQHVTDWLVSKGALIPTETRQEHLDAFIADLDRKGLKPVTQRKYQATISKVYSYSEQGDIRWLNFLPWKRSGIVKIPKRGENITPRIPEPVLGSLMKWALFYVETASDDIEVAANELDRIREPSIRKCGAGERVERVRAYIERRRRGGRGIPAIPARTHSATLVGEKDLRVNYNGVARACGVSDIRGEGRALIDAAINELGLEPGDLDTEISVNPQTGQPWRPRFSSSEMRFEISSLQMACFVMCAMSGMREEEIRRLKVGCCRSEPLFPGGPLRFKVTGGLTKGRENEEAPDWVVIPEIARAIAVAERFTKGEYLFGPWREQIGGDRKLSPGQSNQRINRFAHEVIPRLESLDSNCALPQEEFEQWRFTGRQFRRTVAFYIARQPFGIVAGKIQFKHLSVGAFEGYAGSSPAGFKAEIEEEQQMAGQDRFAEIYETFAHGDRIGGPGGEKLEKLFEDMRTQLGELPGRVVDRRRLTAMLRHPSKQLYIGAINDCLYDQSEALCKGAGGTTDVPVLSECRPAECKNSCVTKATSPEWRSALKEAREAEKLVTSDLQRRVINEAIDSIQQVLETLE